MLNTINNCTGIILMGGQSSRFGSPKGLVTINGRPQWQRLYLLLTYFCNTIKFSLTKEIRPLYREIQEHEVIYDNPNIQSIPNLGGPIVGVLSAMEESYNESIRLKSKGVWLVVAIDLFYLNLNILDILFKNRKADTYVNASVYEEIQPLCAIYELDSAKFLAEWVKKGEKSLSKAISAMPNNLIETKSCTDLPHPLTHINSKRELTSYLKKYPINYEWEKRK